MTELLTAAQMRAIEQAEIASGKVTGLELMERAGQGVIHAVLAQWPEMGEGGHRAVILCGPGNNGGDGFVVARLLRQRGWEIAVGLLGDPNRLPPDAKANHDRWREVGAVHPLQSEADRSVGQALVDFAKADKDHPVLVVDALFGTGLTRAVRTGDGDSVIMLCVELDDLWMEGGPVTRFVAVDLPSGLCADSGLILQPENADLRSEADLLEEDPRFFCLRADLTVTFHAAKRGHVIGWGPRLCGRLRVADIGLPHAGRRADVVELVEPPWPPFLSKQRGHKFDHGHAFFLSGGAGRGGAARLAARGALRIGAGVVTVGCPPDAVGENAARLDAVMLRPLADGAALSAVLADRRINALCLGPALGTGAREAGLVAATLAAKRATVLDADALTLLSRDDTLFAALHGGCVLTPHEGEFGRLFPDIAQKLDECPTKGPAYSKIDAARAAAARAGCVVVFKGADTVIADPSGRCAVNSADYDRATPWLATAGSGDVLAGFIAGLMARGAPAFDAACTGAWLHVEAALGFGPGLIAEDLPEALPAVFRRLGV